MRVSYACAAIALAVSGVGVIASLSAGDWRPSALVRMSFGEPMSALARRADPSFVLVDPQAHYDGVYFYAIARDPLARGEAHALIDRASYRYGHAGFGWLAWALSLGNARAVPGALLILGLTGAALAAWAASRLAHELGRTPWGGLVVALSPGIVFAVTADTSEPVGLAAVALGLLMWSRRRWGWAAAALTAACLIKEPFLLVPAGLAAWEVIEWLRGRKPDALRARAFALVAGPVAFGAWYVYLRVTFGAWPFTSEAHDFLDFPFSGWADSFRRAANLATGSFDRMQVGHASVALLAVIGGILLLAMLRALRMRSWLDPVFLLTALLIFSLNWLGVLYPKDLVREATLALALAPAILAGRRNPVA
jgi:uncharacterized membrane protein YeaQ/YmgE (transglycosylase-associated protein family)